MNIILKNTLTGNYYKSGAWNSSRADAEVIEEGGIDHICIRYQWTCSHVAVESVQSESHQMEEPIYGIAPEGIKNLRISLSRWIDSWDGKASYRIEGDGARGRVIATFAIPEDGYGNQTFSPLYTKEKALRRIAARVRRQYPIASNY